MAHLWSCSLPTLAHSTTPWMGRIVEHVTEDVRPNQASELRQARGGAVPGGPHEHLTSEAAAVVGCRRPPSLKGPQQQRPKVSSPLERSEHVGRHWGPEDTCRAVEHDTDDQSSASVAAAFYECRPRDPVLTDQGVEIGQPHQPVTPGNHRVQSNVDNGVFGVQNPKLTTEDARC